MKAVVNYFCRFDQLIEYGDKMVASNPRMRQVKDRVTTLKQEKAALKDTWCERNDVLLEGQDLQVSILDIFVLLLCRLICGECGSHLLA